MVNSPEFEIFIKNIGILGPFVIIIFTIISHVFAPLAGSPMVLIGYTVYGVVQTSLFLYIASMVSAFINFELARVYGRSLILKLVGKKPIEQIDKFAELSGGRVLILGRLFGFPLFEVISYASGLTKISFRKYMIITLLFGAIPNLAAALILRNTDLSTPTNFYIWTGALLLVGLGFSLVMKEYVDRNIN